MKTYYYVHTGHRFGLDRFRRATTILRAIGSDDITLLCSDFRIANEARNFGVKNAVGIDVVRNIPQIAKHGDRLIFDSDEANPVMLADMRKYFSTFIRISDKQEDAKADGELLISPYLKGEGVCSGYAIDEAFFGSATQKEEFSFFFGDDDYEKDLEKHLDFVSDLEANLQLGFYFFFDYEAMLKKRFARFSEFEEYDTMIKDSKALLTASPQAALESLACGNRPIYFQREDYVEDFNALLRELNIPIIYNYDKFMLEKILSNIPLHEYNQVENFTQKIAEFIKKNLNL